MIGVASFLLSIAIGWAWVSVLAKRPLRPATNEVALHAGLSIALGFGLSSLLYFLLAMAGVASTAVVAPCEVLLLAGGILLARRSRTAVESEPAHTPVTWVPLTLVAVLLALLAMNSVTVTNLYKSAPHGRWDAWSIWNVRARYLAGPGTWHNAVSQDLTRTHPDYPLGTSSLIARAWVYNGRDFSAAVPLAAAIAYSLATLLVLGGALARRRGHTLALVAVCVLLSSTGWLWETVSQYADIPLALYMLAAGALLLAGESAAPLAGVLAGLAAWTKNEGLVFAFALLVGVALFQRRSLPRFAAGLAPVVAFVLIFKLAIAPHADPLFHQGVAAALAHVVDFARWKTVIVAFFAEIGAFGLWYAHPLLLCGALAFALRFRRDNWKQARPLLFVVAVVACADVVVYLITPSDLNWQIGTSMPRLVVQLWPLALAGFVAALGPVPSFVAEQQPSRHASKAAARKTARARATVR